jgi:hypothetical protein
VEHHFYWMRGLNIDAVHGLLPRRWELSPLDGLLKVLRMKSFWTLASLLGSHSQFEQRAAGSYGLVGDIH